MGQVYEHATDDPCDEEYCTVLRYCEIRPLRSNRSLMGNFQTLCYSYSVYLVSDGTKLVKSKQANLKIELASFSRWQPSVLILLLALCIIHFFYITRPDFFCHPSYFSQSKNGKYTATLVRKLGRSCLSTWKYQFSYNH